MDAEKMMMQRRIDNLMEQLDMVKRQRDAAVKDIKIADVDCLFCKHDNELAQKTCTLFCKGCINPCTCKDCFDRNHYEWRGLCAENGGAEDA